MNLIRHSTKPVPVADVHLPHLTLTKQGRFPVFISDFLKISDPVITFDHIMEEIESNRQINDRIELRPVNVRKYKQKRSVRL